MRLVYCKNSLGLGAGMERVLCTKVNYFADVPGYEVFIVLTSPIPENLFFQFSPTVTILSLDIKASEPKTWQFFFKTKFHKEYERKLNALLLDIRPDVTISMFGREILFLHQLNDGSKKVLEFHFSRNYLTHLVEGLPDTKLKWLRKRWVSLIQYRDRYYSKKYNHIVLLTEKDKQLWQGNDRFSVIPNPLSFVSEEKALLENKKILAMGRYIAQKGFDLLIQAFALLKEKFPDWNLFIYGEGPDYDFLSNKIKELSLKDNVFLKNPVQNVEKIMLDSSLFVFPSRYEGFGLVLTEAMTCGVPCVSFDCECGPSDIIQNEVDGFLVEAGNVRLLAEKMELLMQNKELRIEMGGKAKENVRKFDVPVIMNLWKDYFEQLTRRF